MDDPNDYWPVASEFLCSLPCSRLPCTTFSKEDQSEHQLKMIVMAFSRTPWIDDLIGSPDFVCIIHVKMSNDHFSSYPFRGKKGMEKRGHEGDG